MTFARDHLGIPPRPPVAAADVTAIETNDHGPGGSHQPSALAGRQLQCLFHRGIIGFNTGQFGLGRDTGLEPGDQLHPPYQRRHGPPHPPG
jgi:hypothetical protein